jgi:virginiamycin A acetyltransferase
LFLCFCSYISPTLISHIIVKGPIEVGDDVWLGQDAVVLSGVRIGHGAIVGTKAVVTKDVPPYAIVAGNPARVVKMRFDNQTVARLLELAWWDWSHERIQRALIHGALINGDVAAFLEWADNENSLSQL